MANLERHMMSSPYHYCSVCGRRRQLASLTWQLGNLVCTESFWCNDIAGLIGSTEQKISRVLRNVDQEMMPDRKLLSPAAASSGIDEIIL